MNRKTLKFEILFSMLVGSLVCLYLVTKSLSLDTVYEISSENSHHNFLVFYTLSKLSQVYYYTGAWLLMPLAAFGVAYHFLLKRRNKWFDSSFFFINLCFFYSLTYLFSPDLLGEGLKLISEKHVSIAFASVLMILSFVCLVFMNIQLSWGRIQMLFRSVFQEIYSYQRFLNTKVKTISNGTLLVFRKLSKEKLKNKIGTKLKESAEEVITEIVTKPEESQKPELVNSSNVSDTVAEESLPEITKTDLEEVVKRKKTKPLGKFNTKDLINTISKSQTHSQVQSPDKNYFETIIKAIEEKLAEFKLDGKIINVLKGPVVDTFELELGSGVKVSKVTGLSDDIGLALNGAPIRIVYPMRGKSTIGIEVPRNPREFIFLDEVLNSNSFNDAVQRLPIAMGKDAFGEVKVVDLAAMPHMLVAGATGAGKSVFINTLLVSLIIKKSPQQLKLILIDPKQLELALFQDLPHLMLPVLTDPQSSAISLLWAVQEMDRRYSILKELGVKNIEGFNKKLKTCPDEMLFKLNKFYEDEEQDGYELPYIVIVIDEFADLILSKAGKEIELNVNRLAAKARAAGIHLVVATQRPSTDVVTGVIKANFPTRVAFRVSTGHDSKTILDQYGSEKLLGKGDMLYKHGVDLLRLHSSFVEENEIEGLITKLASMPKSFHSGAVDFLENGGEEPFDDTSSGGSGSFETGSSEDPMYDRAIEVVMEQGSASASMIQRRLRVGYNRAANLIEEMERNGIVGPAQGSKPREILSRSE